MVDAAFRVGQSLRTCWLYRTCLTLCVVFFHLKHVIIHLKHVIIHLKHVIIHLKHVISSNVAFPIVVLKRATTAKAVASLRQAHGSLTTTLQQEDGQILEGCWITAAYILELGAMGLLPCKICIVLWLQAWNSWNSSSLANFGGGTMAHQTQVCASLVSPNSMFKHPSSHVLRGERADDFWSIEAESTSWRFIPGLGSG